MSLLCSQELKPLVRAVPFLLMERLFVSHWARIPPDTDGDFAKFCLTPSGQDSKAGGQLYTGSCRAVLGGNNPPESQTQDWQLAWAAMFTTIDGYHSSARLAAWGHLSVL